MSMGKRFEASGRRARDLAHGGDGRRARARFEGAAILGVAAILVAATLLLAATWVLAARLSPCPTPDALFAPPSPTPAACQQVATQGARWGIAIVASLIIGGAAACALGSRASLRERYSATVAATGMSVPVVAAVLMSAAYLGPWFPWLHVHAVLIGTLSSVAGWFVLALPLSRFATAERASPRAYGDLKVRLDRLGAILDTIRPGPAADLAATLFATPRREPAPGGIAYIVVVRNLGSADAEGVLVSLQITGDVILAAPGCPRDEWSRVETTRGAVRTVEYRCRRLAAGAVATFREDVQLGLPERDTPTVAAHVEVSTRSLDANPRNDATDPLLISLPLANAPETGLRLDVLAAPDEVAPGGALAYAVVLSNDSAREAGDLRFEIAPPPGATLVGARADSDAWSFSGTVGQLASLGPGQVAVVHATVAVDGIASADASVAAAFRLTGVVDGSRVERTCSAPYEVALRPGDVLTRGQETALCIARRQYEQAWRSLTEAPDNVGWRWIMASGYITAWNQVHRAEEALLELLPIHELVGEAFQFGLRLRDSNVGSAHDLLDILRRSLTVLSPAAATSLVPGQAPVVGASAAADPPPDSARVAEARSVIRQVVRTVNEFRDSSRDGLLRARGQLMRDVAFAGLTTYVLMCIAVVLGVSAEGLLAALAYYFVGAVVGLFNRLYLDSSADTAIEEDYGLSIVRLIETPLFSGLAALGGVLVTAMLPLALNGGVVTPHAAAPAEVVASATSSGIAATPSATLRFAATPIATPVPTPAVAPTAQAAPPQAAAAQPVPLADIFSIQRYPFGIIMAAIFGLTPTLLISRLSQPVEKYKSDLKSTEASQH